MSVKMIRKGFTLAEVLVTLAVIGVVAAMAIPALIGSTNQAELKTALKKAVAVMNQALVLSIAQDSNDSQCTGCNDKTNLMLLFKNKLNVISNDATSFYTADGMKFIFDKAGVCGNTNDAKPEDANCVVIVDVNGDKGPDQLSTGNSSVGYQFKDRYKLVIQRSAVLPASNDTDDVASAAMFQ